ncbi:neuroguidin [Anopheles stephensi]|uniref:neuroguidin n=1 Tax=Anopheles stephensi TaxID=30069 RepID=UPI001658B258|nr:neuroguidin [Anopheles stephensi]XP_035911201.1 neuroguidin [Anopheles stephensi]XP_035911202.1 neuroguidin [Anopheles stephensi]XP_035911203.1 neuroguidin [Anopheles stephensi]XP_035911204.1 neuroguidin [Anopheles stephensi]XP_035911205.1 neuroguidin [Anopheles stephensi]XP_035911206.1 neuroguidin [Anopheles stephensi]XP_035911207.1 neuroguidin [Anopheles stephensi]XP_035911208.1 neuroguidin [Anopheles stephensi]XP_035911209.1 neuroguidin [Anopheles stephensi]
MVQALDEYDIQPDLPQALRLLDEMNNNFKQVSDLVGNMLQRVKTGELSTEYGLNFLEIKYHMLLNYLINLTYVVLRKCSGHRIEKDPSIDRLIEIRTVLEKIRPIDYKLRYQIDKLVKTAVTGSSTGTTDPTAFRANPANLMPQMPAPGEEAGTGSTAAGEGGPDTDDGAESDSSATVMLKLKRAKEAAKKGGAAAGRDEEDGAARRSKSDVYVPPKLTSMPYEEDTKADRARKQLERAKKRALGSSLIQDLKDEYLDTPVELSSSSRAQQILSRREREREEYEETYLTRLPVTKADKHRSRKLTTLASLGDELTSFTDISVLNEDYPSTSTGGSGGKKRKAGKVNKKHGKKRRFR